MSPVISATGSCPDVATISAIVAALIPKGGLSALPPDARIDVADLGESYRVVVMTKQEPHTRVYPLSGVLGVGLEPRTDFGIADLEAREARLPFDLGVRWQRAPGAVELGFEAGVAAAVFSARGTNAVMPNSGTRLDVGGRAAVTLRLARPRARLAPVAGLHALYFPKPYEITTTPAGALGHTPSLWLGGTLGLSASF